MLENIEEFSSNWFIHDGKDISEYNNVSIGSAIHDDILIFHNQLYHLLAILDKIDYKNNDIIFYQSKTNQLPNYIIILLIKLGVKIENTDDKYPFLSYEESIKRNAFSRVIYSGIVYDKYSKTKFCKCADNYSYHPFPDHFSI